MARQKKDSAPKRAPAKPASEPPAAPKQPGLLKQVAANAAGVAVGSAVGHVVANKVLGGSGSEKKQDSSASIPCDFEWQQFVRCAKDNSNMVACKGLLDTFNECVKRSFN